MMVTLLFALALLAQERKHDPNEWIGGMDRVCFSVFVGTQSETWIDHLMPSPDRRDPPPQAEVVPVEIDVLVAFSPAAVEAGYQGMLPNVMAEYNHVHLPTRISFNVVAEYRLEGPLAFSVGRKEAGDTALDLADEYRQDINFQEIRERVGADLVMTWMVRPEDSPFWGNSHTPRTREAFTPENGYVEFRSRPEDDYRMVRQLFGHQFNHALGLTHGHLGAAATRNFVAHTARWVAEYAERGRQG